MYVGRKLVSKIRHDKVLLLGWGGAILGIAIGMVRSHHVLPPGSAIISDFIILIPFAVALFLLFELDDEQYGAMYALGLFVVSILSPAFQFFLPATTLILGAALLRFFRQEV